MMPALGIGITTMLVTQMRGIIVLIFVVCIVCVSVVLACAATGGL